MAHFYPEIQIARLKEVYNRLKHEIVIEAVPLTAEGAVTHEPVPYSDRLSLAYQSYKQGDKWGDAFDCGWFHVKGQIPAEWAGSYITLNLDFNGESCIFDDTGCPMVGFTSGSVFDSDYSKDMIHYLPQCQGDERIDIWVETGANGLFGVQQFADPNWYESPDQIFGTYPACIRKLRVCRFDYDKWQLFIDLMVIINLVEALAPGTARRMQLLRIASKALNFLPPERGGAKAAREAMKAVYELPPDPATVHVSGIGHSHIDTAWLWPIRETVRKVGRTFASQVGLIERYPGYKYGSSQPQLYAFCKQHYPALYEKVKKAVKKGAWELQGGMWVEADCNIPSGESLVRQLLVGRNFYRDEFGVDVPNVWLPDVFGYSANLPQIMKTAGVDYFLTQKISWNRHNKFPHNTFIWQGVEGSQVLAHFPPEDNYNSPVMPRELRKHETNNGEAGLIEDAISLYGIGDGGGGPKEEYIERGLRCHHLNGCPQFNFEFAQPALERMNQKRDELNTWVGELYLEMHRATFTSQAQTKRWNRRAEEALRATEMLCSLGDIKDYPYETLLALWKDFLCGQFHDIIPGSSINRVYRENVPMLQKVVAECKRLQNEALAGFWNEDEKAWTLFNPSSTDFDGALKLPEGWKSASLNGNALLAQREADDYLVWAQVPARTFVTLTLSTDDPVAATTSGFESTSILENEEVRYTINAQLQVVSCFDKTRGIELIQPGQVGNTIQLFDDHPTQYDAWDYEEYAEEMPTHAPEILTIERIEGPVRTGIMAVMRLNESTFVQTAWLGCKGKRLDFVTEVDWKENHKIARVAFPVTVNAPQAHYEIAYATYARDTHNNTRWQYAQFEVVGHRYADLSEPDHGVALLTDSKYGYRIKDSVISLSLLRAPTYPDPVCDRGQHHFIYSFLPHTGTLGSNDEVVTSAAILNQGVESFLGKAPKQSLTLPANFVGEGVELAVLKRAEKENCWIVRLVERRGCSAQGTLSSPLPNATWTECQSSEWTDLSEALPATTTVQFHPFEIKTFKLKF